MYTEEILKSRGAFVSKLACPNCHAKMVMTDDGKSAFCLSARRHLFDFSSTGYLNLAPHHSDGGDDANCVRARSEFLSSGHFSGIADAICEIASSAAVLPGALVDAGCGEGYYTLRLAKAMPDRFHLGFDLSKAAVGTASKAAKRENVKNVGFGVASVFSMPVLPNETGIITSIFAPCAEDGFAAVLPRGGHLILAGAGEDHLIELKSAIYQTAYKNDTRRDLPRSFEELASSRVRYTACLSSNREIASLFAMTPYFYRTSKADRDKLAKIDSLRITIDVIIRTYQKVRD